MNILQSIKNLYKGEDALAVHTSIFALAGITAVSFVNIAALFIGHSIYSIFSAPNDNAAILFSLTGIMIFLFFTGYKYKYANKIFEDENSALPSVSMDCFTIFAKIFPLFFIWGIYLFVFFLIGGIVIGTVIKGVLLFLLLMLLLLFLNVVFIIFSKNFEYKKEFFNPFFIFSVIKKLFVPVLIWIIQFIILFSIITFCFKYLFKIVYLGETRMFQLSMALGLTCLSGYVQEVMNLAYFNGITKIIKKNFTTES